jgi:GH15 family glucan-1,4-alpha-glucosidase
VLKLLTYTPTGAIVAPPTTSLPEAIGEDRNWDYRFTWLRDSALTLHSLLLLGFTHEAEAFGEWLLARLQEWGEDDGPLQPMYTIHGGRDMPETELDHLEGYRRSGPVRVGNGAYQQQQLDVYGELLDAVWVVQRRRGIHYRGWLYVQHLTDWLRPHWQAPAEGIWEVRGGQKEFVHSGLMCWVAFDRAIRIAGAQGLPASIKEWTSNRDAIYDEIMEKGWNDELESFIQYYGSDAVDASALLMSLTGFTAGADPRMAATIDRIQHELMHEPHVYR